MSNAHIGFVSFYVCPICETKGGGDLKDKSINDDAPGKVNGVYMATCTKCGHVASIDTFLQEPDVEVYLCDDGDIDSIILTDAAGEWTDIQHEIKGGKADNLADSARENHMSAKDRAREERDFYADNLRKARQESPEIFGRKS